MSATPAPSASPFNGSPSDAATRHCLKPRSGCATRIPRTTPSARRSDGIFGGTRDERGCGRADEPANNNESATRIGRRTGLHAGRGPGRELIEETMYEIRVVRERRPKYRTPRTVRDARAVADAFAE